MKTIGIIALAGDVDKNKIHKAKLYLENKGFRVELSKNIFEKVNYLAGSDDVKIEELHNFFKNPNIDLILNARGGYGSIRIINKIDYDLIKNNPKPFIGFSDITALLLMIYKQTGIITYHGPMACSDFANPNAFTEENFWNTLDGKKIEVFGNTTYKEGKAEGIIWGGNLSTVVSLCGQDFIPDKDFIFFAEDLNEPVYKIDKMFTQLFNIDKFKNYCKGIVLGDFLDVDNSDYLNNLFNQLPVPNIGGAKITHLEEKLTIPIGKFAYLKDNKLVID